MARVSRVDPFDREIDLLLSEMQSPEARAQMLAEFAASEIEEAKSINRAALGADVKHEVYVDGKRGAPLPSVRPDGVVFAEWQFLAPVLAFVRDSLTKASPVRSGRFRQSHLLFIDGEELNASAALPDAFQEAVFVNSQPYSRKLEEGLSNQAPQGVYQAVAALASRRFGNLARVSFAYRALTGVSSLNTWAERTGLAKQGRRTMSEADRSEWLRRQPTIFVEPF